jgi:hypothetical protein
MSVVENWSEITDHFQFVEERLVYVDAPLEGLLRAKTGELFAFRVLMIIDHTLWHWVIVPVDSLETEVADAFLAAQKKPARWLSVVEDRRGDEQRITAAWMTPKQPVPR